MIDEEILAELEVIKTELEAVATMLGKIVVKLLDEKYKEIAQEGEKEK